MACTTVLVGKRASNDGSTMIARTDDGSFTVKKMVVVRPKDQKRRYKSAISHLELELPEHPLRYTACPSVDPTHGIWAATGINEANVGMTATETITSNPRVLAADPLVSFQKAKKRGEKDIPGGIGEEDMVVLVLPYIRTAREGVLRLGQLLETYGTYESNGIAFNDGEEIWWLETVGGHHWLAKRVPDEVCVVAPNQFGMDAFDLEDAFGPRRAHLCSADLRSFIAENCLDCSQDGVFHPRNVFGSHTDMDHIYNTPRAWFLGRYLTPRTHRWEGENAEFTPESDDIPWAFVPERKLAVEDVKYMLSTHYQGTPYNPYAARDTGMRGKYRPVGINRTDVTAICQIRQGVPEAIRGLQWVGFSANPFNAWIPVYPNVDKLPDFLSGVTLEVSTDNLYWCSRLIGALADAHYPTCIQLIERYQNAVAARGRQLVLEYDRRMTERGDGGLAREANEAICAMAREETVSALGKVLQDASLHMKNGFNRADN